MITALLRYSAMLSWRHPVIVVLIATLLSAASGVYALFNLKMNANTDDLIAPDRPYMVDYRQFIEEFGDLEFIYVVVAAGDQPAEAEEVVRKLTDRLQQVPGAQGVLGDVSSEDQLHIATRAMSQDELENLAKTALAFPTLTSDQGGAAALEKARQLLGQLIQGGTELDPERQQELGASAVLLLQTVASAAPDSPARKQLSALIKPPPQYLKSDSGGLYFILILPMKDYSSLEVIARPLAAMRQVIASVQAEHPNIEIGLTGKPVLQADEMATSNRDTTIATVIALVLVALVFVLFSGSLVGPMLAMFTLLIAIGLTFGFAALAVGQLNLLSVVFTLILIGLGIDFGIHLFTRFREERMKRNVWRALLKSLTTAGRGNLFGAITSSVAFFVAVFTDFQGLRELGIIAGGGLIICVACMTLILPALLAWHSRRRRSTQAPVDPNAWRIRSESRVVNLLLRRPKWVLAGLLAITLVLLPLVRHLRFEENLLKLQARGLESVEWEHRILEDSDGATWFGAITVDDIARIPAITAQARQLPHIGRVQSVLDIIQYPTQQREMLRDSLHRAYAATPATPPAPAPAELTPQQLRSLAPVLTLMASAAVAQAPEEAQMLRQLGQDLATLADQLEQNPQPTRAQIESQVQQVGQSLRVMLEGDKLPLRDALPAPVRATNVSPDGKFLVRLHPVADVWEMEAMQAYVSDMRKVDPHVTGVPITHLEAMIEMKRSFANAALMAMVVVALLIYLDFRSVRYTLVAMLPLALAGVWTVELMAIFGLQFNLANFFSVPILIGIGVDNGIHIVHRYREGGPLRFQMGSTRRAALLTSLTTIIGFGSLMIAHHRGLASLGTVMSLGMASCVTAALIALPPLLAGLERFGWIRPKKHTPRHPAR